MNRKIRIKQLKKELKEMEDQGKATKKVGFIGGLKKSVVIFGKSAKTVASAMGDAGKTVLHDPLTQKKNYPQKETYDINEVLRRLPQ